MRTEFPDIGPAALVDTNFVRLVRRMDADGIAALVECGGIKWVWNISLAPRVREMRFLMAEIITPQMTARLTLDEVLDRLLPRSRRMFWAREVGQLLLLARNTVAKLARRLGATQKNRSFQFSRTSLVAWLRERWLGGFRTR
jgi:hypothetical protein